MPFDIRQLRIGEEMRELTTEQRNTALLIELAIDEYGLPDYMAPGLQLWVVAGIPPGDFLSALLQDAPWSRVLDLADDRNRECLPQWRRLLANRVPSACWHSSHNFKVWAEHHGMFYLRS